MLWFFDERPKKIIRYVTTGVDFNILDVIFKFIYVLKFSQRKSGSLMHYNMFLEKNAYVFIVSRF